MIDYKAEARDMERILELDPIDEEIMDDDEWERYYNWLLKYPNLEGEVDEIQ